MTKKQANLKIPLQSKDNDIEKALNGIIATISNLQDSLITRIEKIELRLNGIEKIEFPNYSNEFMDVKKDLISLKTLGNSLNSFKSDVKGSLDYFHTKVFEDNFDKLNSVLDSSIKTYFESNQELLERFKIIEHNTHSNIESLTNIVKHQIYDPLDYLYITEQFNLTNKGIGNIYNQLVTLTKDRELLRKDNPYICEVIKYKDLPIAEFSNFGKAVVYKYGWLFKRIAFFRNDGKNWIRIK